MDLSLASIIIIRINYYGYSKSVHTMPGMPFCGVAHGVYGEILAP